MLGDEDVLHLQVAARVEQRRGVDEALGGAAREVEADVVRRLGQQIVEGRAAHALRQVRVVALVERAQPLLEPEGVPDARPERHARARGRRPLRGRSRAAA